MESEQVDTVVLEVVYILSLKYYILQHSQKPYGNVGEVDCLEFVIGMFGGSLHVFLDLVDDFDLDVDQGSLRREKRHVLLVDLCYRDLGVQSRIHLGHIVRHRKHVIVDSNQSLPQLVSVEQRGLNKEKGTLLHLSLLSLYLLEQIENGVRAIHMLNPQ